MSTPKAIVAALKTKLEESAYLSDIEQVLIDERETLTLFPCIMIDAEIDEETEESDVNNFVRLILRVRLVIAIKMLDKDSQVVDDDVLTGLMSIRNSVAKALCADHTLGGTANWLRIIGTDYNHFKAYPQRRAAITIEIEFEQNAVSR